MVAKAQKVSSGETGDGQKMKVTGGEYTAFLSMLKNR